MTRSATRATQTVGDLLQQEIAGRVAERVVDLLEAVEVDQHHRDLRVGRALPREHVGESLLEQDAVREPGEIVVQGFVAQAVDEPRVVQRDAGVRGDRLEEPAVLFVEGADVTQPVGDAEDADHFPFGDERRHDAVALAALREMGTDLRVACGLRTDNRAAALDERRERRVQRRLETARRDVGVGVENEPVDALIVARSGGPPARRARPASSAGSARAHR